MIIEVWNPATNRVLRTLPAPAQLVAAGGDFVVWSTNPGCLASCPRHVLDLRSGNERLVALPPHMEWDSEAIFAPDGRHVGLVAHEPITPAEKGMRDIPAAGTYTSIVMVVDPSSGQKTERRLTTWKGRTRLAWSPDGSLLFVVRDDAHLDYFNTKFENSPFRELTVPRADAFLVAAKPTTPK
jgi:Tol biopolymer transport system component